MFRVPKLRWMIAVLLVAAPLATAPPGAAAQGCPDGFHLHPLGEADHHDGAHRHVGLAMAAVDRNGNGLICVKHATPGGGIHVHIDAPPA
jgi:hypothetical protein